MSVEPVEEIGGYFGLALPDFGDHFPVALKFQSARAALRAVLESAGIKRIMIPAYICGCIPGSLAEFGVTAETYYLDDSLYPVSVPEFIPEGCVFLYVNYFGLCQSNVDRLLGEIPPEKVVIDNSQALFAKPGPAWASIYSVRKFIGVPDGGLLMTSDTNIKVPEDEDTESFGRMKHLLLRMAHSARDGYASYLESEKTLNNAKPLRMSRLTKRLLASSDMKQTQERRRENFLVLAAELGMYNTFKWTLDAESVPLCYPLVLGSDVDRLRRKLAARNIFIPTYWPDAQTPTSPESIEHRLVHRSLAVPCDQRYSHDAITRLAGELIASVKNQN